MKKYLFLSLYKFLLCLFYVLLLIVGKNEIFASFAYKVDNVEYIKRGTTSDNPNCTQLNFSDVLSKTKVFGFYDPLKPLENNYPVIKFIKEIRIDYLNYIVDINNFETNGTIVQELNDLRSNFPGLQILLSITSIDLNNNLVNKNQGEAEALISSNPVNYSEAIKIIAEKVKTYELDGVNIVKNDCNGSLNDTLNNIYTMRSSYSNKDWITTFTVNVNDNETPLNNITDIQDYVNYTIIQAFYLNPNDNNSAPLYSNSSNIVTFNSLFNKLKGLNVDFTKLIWGFDLSGIINPSSVNGLIKNDDECLKNWNKISILPWKEIRNTALTDMCIAKKNYSWSRYFETDTNSTILSNSQLNVSFSYEDPESLYHKFNWVTSNNFTGISIANLAFDSVDNSILKFIKLNDGKGPGSNSISHNNNKNNGVIIGVVVGCILFAIGLFMIFYYCSRRRKRHSAIKVKSIEDKHHYLDQPVVSIPPSPTPPPPSPSPTPQQNSVVPTNGIYVSALYDFEGKEENELNFRKGDLIEVIEKGDGPNSWWKGKINGIVGDFPGNYVVVK